MIAAFVTGNIGSDPELKFLQDGTAVLNMSVASNERQKIGGEWKDHPVWVKVTVFGKRAEGLAKILEKGSKVGARGALTLRDYETRDGRKGSSLEMRADEVEPLGGMKREERRPAQQSLGDDDIPF